MGCRLYLPANRRCENRVRADFLGLNKTDYVEQNLASLPKLLRMLAIKSLKETMSCASVVPFCTLGNQEPRFHKFEDNLF